MAGREWTGIAAAAGAAGILYGITHRSDAKAEGMRIAATIPEGATVNKFTLTAARAAVHVTYASLPEPAKIASAGIMAAADGFADAVLTLDNPSLPLTNFCEAYQRKVIDMMKGGAEGAALGVKWMEPYLVGLDSFKDELTHAVSLPGLFEAADKSLDKAFGSKSAKWAFYIGIVVVALSLAVGYLGIFTPLGGMAITAAAARS